MEKICILCGSKYIYKQPENVCNDKLKKDVMDKQKVVQTSLQIDYGFIHQL